MTRYLISFDDGAMTFPEEDLPDVAEAAHAVVQEAKDAGVWVFGGGLHSHEEVSVVATDGTITDGPEDKAYIGGFSVVDVSSREEALEWAAKVAVACRCAQEVREFGPGSREEEWSRECSSRSGTSRRTWTTSARCSTARRTWSSARRPRRSSSRSPD
jgi:hypothetical protein